MPSSGLPTPVARPLVRRADRPLWQQLLDDLRARLAADDFASAFPGELALVGEYGVSRHTVREALRHLRTEGVVTASRGRRPQLVPEVELRLGALTSLFGVVEAHGLVQRSVVRALDVRADGTVATRLGLEESTPLVHLERLRLAGDEPLAIDRVWLPASLARPLLDVDFTRTALYDELSRHCGITLTGGQERVRALIASRTERALLQLPPNQAVLSIERTGCSDGRPVEWRHTLVRGDRFAVTTAFDRRGYTTTALATSTTTHDRRTSTPLTGGTS